MNKLFKLFICGFVSLSLLACNNESIQKDSPVIEWFDTIKSEEIINNELTEYHLDEFSDSTFTTDFHDLIVKKDDISRLLFSGTPILNIYFKDLNGDNMPEICASVSEGFGVIDKHIVVYDYANSKSYKLVDRNNFDYLLSLEEGQLLVTKYIFMTNEIVKTSELVLMKNNLKMK